MQNESHEHNDLLTQKLKKSFETWNPSFDDETLWRNLSNSLDTEKDFNQLKEDVTSSNIEVPGDIWATINYSLDENFVDEKLKSDYKIWNPNPSESAFEQIKESIQLEKVWNKLDQSLIQEKKKQIFSFPKLLILTTLLCISYFTNDHFLQDQNNKMQLAYNQSNPTNLKVNNPEENIEKNNLTQIKPEKILRTKSERKNNLLATNNEKELIIPQDQVNNIFETEDYQSHLFNPLKKLPVIQNPIFNGEEELIFSSSQDKPRMKDEFGLNYFTTINLIQNNQINKLTTNVAGLGYEFGLFFRHKIKNLSQEYCINYNVFKQTENTFDNGTFTQSKYTISGIKINSFTSFPLFSKFNLGGGISTFMPIQAVKQRENTIVDLPKINAINFGLNLGVDYRLQTIKTNKLSLCFKYETIFSLNNSTANFKLFQNYNLGLKYIF